jgi:hypothetical protein
MSASERDRRTPVFELLPERDELSRRAAAVAKSAIVEHEDRIAGLGERHGEISKAAAAG